MAYTPSLTRGLWPSLAKPIFLLGALLLLIAGIVSIIFAAQASGVILGIIGIIVALLMFFGIFTRGWLSSTSI